MTIFDDVVSGIVDAFFQEGNNWKERIGNADIILTSPETSTEFVAKWINSSKSVDKKVGLFDYPNIQGTVAQDLKSSSNRFSISFRFTDYENNDLFARDFFAIAAKETGQWTIIHPVYGLLGLQLISMVEDKTSNEGGFTQINTEWIEAIDENKLLTTRELSGLVDGQCSVVQLNSIEQFVELCDQSSKSLRSTIENTVDGIGNVVDFILSPLFAVENTVSSAMTSIKLAIQGSIDAVLLPLSELAGQIQNLVNIPLLAAKDTKSRINKYASLRNALTNLLPGGSNSITATWATDLEKRNNIVTAELASISSIVAFSQILLTSNDITSRLQALDLAQQMLNEFSDLVDKYDEQQQNQESALIEEQYFSNSSVYNDIVTLVGLSFQYLLSLISNLKIEKKIILSEPRATIEVCISEYGTIDEYDNLIAHNKLKGSEIFWLPAGKEITLYV